MNEKKQEVIPTSYPAYAYAPAEDEIDLVDLWITITRYQALFLKVAALLLVLGILAIFLVFQEKYSLVSMIQIGTVERENSTVMLEPPESLVSKIENVLAPGFTQQWMSENDTEKGIEAKVSHAKQSETILISNVVKEDDLDQVTEFQNGLVKLIIEDHRGIISSLKAEIISKLELAQLKLAELKNPVTLGIKLKANEIRLEEEVNKLSKLKDERFFGIRKDEFQNRITSARHKLELEKKSENILKEQLTRVQETRELLSKNMESLDAQIKRARQTQQQAQTNVTELSAMSQLLIDNEIQQNQDRLQSLEERYFVTLENDKSALLQKIEQSRMQQIEKAKEVNVLEQKYNELLLDNQLQIEQQKLVIEKVKLELDRVKFQHDNAVSEEEQRVKEIQTRLDNYNETRRVSPPVKSLEPVGTSKKVLLALAIFFAIFGAFIVVLVKLFNDKVKQRKQELA